MAQATTKSVKFNNLPEEFHIGHAVVYPCSPLCSDLVECFDCGFVSTDFYKCAEAHVTCKGCTVVQTPSGNTETRDELMILCSHCGKYVAAVRVVISSWFLRMLQFACACGVEGRLDEIKSHLGQPRNTCLLLAPEPRTVMAGAIAEALTNRDKLRMLKKEAEGLKLCLAGLQTELDGNSKLLDTLNMYFRRLKLMLGYHGMIFFPVRRNQEQVWQLSDPKAELYYIRCLPLRVKPIISEYDGERWLSVRIEAVPPPNFVKSDLNISLKVHDRSGGIVVEKLAHLHFKEKKNFDSFSKIVRVDDFDKKHLIADDYLCISIELWPQSDKATKERNRILFMGPPCS